MNLNCPIISSLVLFTILKHTVSQTFEVAEVGISLDATPVIPWEGEKLFGESDCLDWDAIAKIQLSSNNPEQKKKEIEPKACKLSHGLECINIPDSNGALKDSCECLISIGSRAIALPDKDDNKKCYIPAGLGWVSECFDNGSPPDINFPSPYGDPRGSGPDPPIQVDQFNAQQGGGDRKVEYLQWNTIQLRCVPNSICREGANYIGRRCQCLKTSILDRETGTCSFAPRIDNPYNLIRYFGTLQLIALSVISLFT